MGQIADGKLSKERAFVEVLSAIDEYLVACEHLSATLKAGWFSLARAKYAAAGGALGQAAYPGDMQASSVVTTTAPGDPDDVFDRFELRQQQAASALSKGQAEEHHAGLQKRTYISSTRDPATAANGNNHDGEPGSTQHEEPSSSSRGHSSTGGGTRDPLLWFGGGLPTADLRQAQRDFRGALTAAVEAANRLQRLKGAADALLDAGSGAEEEGGHRTVEEFGSEIATVLARSM